MTTQLYAAKDVGGTTRGYVHAESAEDARHYFASGVNGPVDFDSVVLANHIGPHTPNPGGCHEGCVS